MGKTLENQPRRDRWPLAIPLIAMLTLGLTSCHTQDENHHHYHPEVSVPDGHEQAFKLFAEGVQIYTWTGTNWLFRAPEADLYDASRTCVGKHYKGSQGPVWEATDGSKVVGSVVAKAAAYHSNSIPHLLLKAVSSTGNGAFSGITFIQRVNTEGGVAPANPGNAIGQEARVPYHAEYVFYHKEK